MVKNNKRGVKVEIDGTEFKSLTEAAKFLDMSLPKLQGRLARYNPYFYQGFKITRAPQTKIYKGTTVVCLETNQSWSSAKALAIELGVKPGTLQLAIHKKQQFVYDGKHYVAVDYKCRKLNRVKGGSRERIDNQPELPLTQQIKELKEVVLKTATEDECFKLLKKLAIERIQNTQYEKASKVLSALELLSN